MDINIGVDEWPVEYTREEMLEQHAHLLEEENHLLQKELDRYRRNMAKLIGMHDTAVNERHKLAIELAQTQKQISELNNQHCEDDRKIGALKNILFQREAVMRQHKIPECYFGTPRNDL